MTKPATAKRAHARRFMRVFALGALTVVAPDCALGHGEEAVGRLLVTYTGFWWVLGLLIGLTVRTPWLYRAVGLVVVSAATISSWLLLTSGHSDSGVIAVMAFPLLAGLAARGFLATKGRASRTGAA